LALGPLAALTPVALALANLDSDSAHGEDLLIASALAAPAVAGLTVCALGHLSTHEGSCFASVGGAYLGALAGGLAAFYLAGHDEGAPPSQIFAACGGPIAGTMLGSTIAWHASKTPRARPPATGPE